MITRSYWEDISFFREPEYLIIGAGFVGLYTAYFLKKARPEADIVVVERGPFSNGASTKNAGFACFGSASELWGDVAAYGRQKVVDTVRMRYEGLEMTRKILGDRNIDYVECGGVDVFPESDRSVYVDCVDNLLEINTLTEEATGIANVFSAHTGNPVGCKGFTHFIRNKAEGSLNTASLYNGLMDLCRKEGVRLLFGLNVVNIDTDFKTVEFEFFDKLSCPNIIVTTNGFASRLLPVRDVQFVRNQVLVTEVIQGLELKECVHYNRGFFYFRQVDGRILIGGGRNVLGDAEMTDEMSTTNEAYDLLRSVIMDHIAVEAIPQVDYHWAGVLGVGSDKKPIIEQINPGIFVGVRMGGMGVAIAPVVGKKLTELVVNS